MDEVRREGGNHSLVPMSVNDFDAKPADAASFATEQAAAAAYLPLVGPAGDPERDALEVTAFRRPEVFAEHFRDRYGPTIAAV